MTDLNKAIELAEKAAEQLQKSHVKQYTRSNGTVVAEHEDRRQAKAKKMDSINNTSESDFKKQGGKVSHHDVHMRHEGNKYTVERENQSYSAHNKYEDAKEEFLRHMKNSIY